MSLHSRRTDLPNLPGFRSNAIRPQRVRQTLTYCNGYAIEKDQPFETNLTRQLTNFRDLEARARKPPAAPTFKIPVWLANDRLVYKFYAFFKESVAESADENYRVRKCTILYYLNDGSIQVSEAKQENSGINQGTFIKRHKIPGPHGRFITEADFMIGETISIYGRTFKIVDCDDFTRRDLLGKGFAVGKPSSYPDDKFTIKRTDFMRRETGADPTMYRGVVNNPMKEFVEARLGNASKNNRMLGQFLSEDRRVLRFDCYWDDRSRYAGELRFFKLHYYLASDEIEIIEIFAQNSGFDKMPKLLQKSKLNKPGFTLGDPQFIGVDDLKIGVTLDVFRRPVVLTDADQFTREWYQKNKGIVLGKKLVKWEQEKVLPRETEPPEHNGFGTEADSRKSWESLHPMPPRKDTRKMMMYSGKVLYFKAKLVADGKKQVLQNDLDRVFIFRYFLADDSMMIFEPPQRNSGIIGGKFLLRGRHKNPDTGRFFSKEDFKVNGKIRVSGRCFQIMQESRTSGAGASTGMRSFTKANIRAIINKLENKLRRNAASLAKTFRLIDKDKSNYLTYDEMKEFLYSYFSDHELTDQEVFVIVRYFDTDGEGRIDYNEFAAKILGKDIGINTYTTTTSLDAGGTEEDGDEIAMNEEDLAKYERVLIQAVEEDAKAAFLRDSLAAFKQNAEAIPAHKLKQQFKANDVDFKQEITFDRFQNFLTQQDAGESNSGDFSIKLSKERARVVTEELFRRVGKNNKDSMTFIEFRQAFNFSS